MAAAAPMPRFHTVKVSIPVALGVSPSKRTVTELVVTALVGILGGGGLAKAGAAWNDRKRLQGEENKTERTQAIELTARVFDENDDLRTLLMNEAQQARQQLAEAMERAHRAEVSVAVATAEIASLKIRLERKDEANKAMVAQVMALGATPVAPGSTEPARESS